MRDYLELTKPRVTWLILMSTAMGYVFGLGGGWEPLVLAAALLGTGLLASGTFALNQWMERAADSRMHRTRSRPLPSGRVSPPRAFWFGMTLAAAGFLALWQGTNLLAAGLGLFTLLSYLLAYTPLKSRTPHATTVGALPGAMPPLIGYAAAAGALGWPAWLLFAILFLWQFPHFHSIAWLYREDYARAGIRMLPVVEPDGESTARQILAASLLLIPVTLLPAASGVYLAGALLLGAGFFYFALQAAKDRTRAAARGVLLASVVYLPCLFALMLAGRIWL